MKLRLSINPYCHFVWREGAYSSLKFLHAAFGLALRMKESFALARALRNLHVHHVGTQQQKRIAAIAFNYAQYAVHPIKIHLLILDKRQVAASFVLAVGIVRRK